MGDLIIKPASSGSLKIQDQAGTDKITLDSSGAIASLPTGMIIQVQFTQYSNDATMTNIADDTDHVLVDGHASDGTGTEILNVDITPISTSSKIWLQCSWCGEFANAYDPSNTMFFFYRDSTKLGRADAGSRQTGIMPPSVSFHLNQGSTLESCFYQYFDTPSTTSQITYKVGLRSQGSGTTLYTNRTMDDTDNDGFERGISSICAIEIAG